MIDLAHLEACLALGRKYNARALNVKHAVGPSGETSFEVVFEPAEPPKKEPDPEAPVEGAMPTRAEIEAMRKRLSEGGPK